MADLISREALIKAYLAAHKGPPGGAFKLIQDAPAVDAEPVKRGKWLTCEDGWGDVHYQCSECGQEWCLNDGTPEENGMSYCPHCGANMEVEG